MDLVQLISSINTELRQQLEKHHCVRGELRYQAPSMVSFSGTRSDNKPMLIWQNESRLPYLLSLYVEQLPNSGGVTIAVDLARETFNHKSLSTADIHRAASNRQREQQAEDKRLLQERRKELAQQTNPYGMELAAKVADALLRGSVGYGHRDYCGTGLEYREGVYCYGELWDGYMTEPILKWAAKQDFISWLAQQSDASMARLEAKEPFYWGNQTITRHRLTYLLY